MSRWSEIAQRILASYTLPQLRRIRWSVIVVMVIAVAASVGANILHAKPNWISWLFAAWPPIAFLLVVDVISRIPATRPLVSGGRILAALVVTGIAGFISYGHMRASAEEYGETGWSAILLPISVDGLIVVCSLSLIELATAIRLKLAGIATIDTTHATARPAAAAPSVEQPAPAPQPAAAPAGNGNGGNASPAQQQVPVPAQVGVVRSGRPQDDEPLPERLVTLARQVGTAFKQRTGKDITRIQLREDLAKAGWTKGISNVTATRLLALLRSQDNGGESQDQDHGQGRGEPVAVAAGANGHA